MARGQEHVGGWDVGQEHVGGYELCARAYVQSHRPLIASARVQFGRPCASHSESENETTQSDHHTRPVLINHHPRPVPRCASSIL